MNESTSLIDHEVRIRLLEKIAENNQKNFDYIQQQFKSVHQEMRSQFHWILGVIISLFGATLLTLITTIILSITRVI